MISYLNFSRSNQGSDRSGPHTGPRVQLPYSHNQNSSGVCQTQLWTTLHPDSNPIEHFWKHLEMVVHRHSLHPAWEDPQGMFSTPGKQSLDLRTLKAVIAAKKHANFFFFFLPSAAVSPCLLVLIYIIKAKTIVWVIMWLWVWTIVKLP